jgi:glucan phosphoethanolaminetransferase (alkaline phosphatase superfamily)
VTPTRGRPVWFAEWIALDLLAWYALPICIILLYVVKFSRPATSVGPHLLIVGIPLLAVTLARFTLARLPVPFAMRITAAGILAGTAFSLMVFYYLVLLVGLYSWGGVPAWTVIPTFFQQMPILLEALASPPWVAAAAAILMYVGVLCAWVLYLRRNRWPETLAPRVTRITALAVIVLGVALCASGVYQLFLGTWVSAGEPLSLTVSPPTEGMDLEGYTVNPLRAAYLDRFEDRARSTYTVSQGKGRNLVLIVVDALRPDHMGLNGYSRDTTPNLSHLSRQLPLISFSDVHSSCADTICGMYSLFSSQFPRNFSSRPFTLHDALRRNGYRLHLILSGDHTLFHSLANFYGPVDTFYDGTQAHGFFLNDDRLVLDRLAHMPDWNGTPVMLQFHLMSAHILRRGDFQSDRYQPAARYVFSDSHDTGPGGTPPQTAVNFYDNGVIGADSIIQQLLNTLGSKGFLNDTLVVITADHGEGLGEHGLFHHANSVREQLLRIPLVFIWYGSRPDSPLNATNPLGQIDIAPSILTDLGLIIPATWTGHPWQIPYRRPFSYFDEHSLSGLIDRRDPAATWKYWVDHASGAEHVFNLSTDPGENLEKRDAVPNLRISEWRAQLSNSGAPAATPR